MRNDTTVRVVAPAGLIAERYRLLRPLGSGASATVWAAVDETLGRQVALKLLSGPAAFDEAEREQLRSEARALATLAHPRVIVVFDYLETPGLSAAVQPVLVTELLEGRDLATWLLDGPLPWQVALGVCGQLAEALAAAHEAGIVHRDVAPANVMLTASGVKLLDFGIAQGPTDRVPSGELAVGTPVCMSPEQVTGRVALPASDMYAFGCVLHWCLTGRPPYQDKDITKLNVAHLRATAPPLRVPGLPQGIVQLYLCCLAKDPTERPTAAQAAEILAPYARRSAADLADSGASTPDADADAATALLPVLAGVPDGAGQVADGGSDPGSGALAVVDSARPPTSHAGRRRPLDRRMLPAALLFAALFGVGAIVLGLAYTITDGTSASQAPGAGSPNATSSPTMTAASPTTAPNVVLPSASSSASGTASASSSAPAMRPVAAVALPDPAADPIGYLQGVAAQVQMLVSQGPYTLQAGAGQQLINEIGTLQSAVTTAQQGRGKKQWRAVSSDLATVQQQVSDDAAAGEMSQEAASLLSSELQRLAGALPTG